MSRPIAFRNVVRYVREPEKNVPLYEALGFRLARSMGGMAILQNEEGLKLLLHEGEPEGRNVSALGFTMIDNDVGASRAFVEKAGWRLLRAPDSEDQGFFYIYGDPRSAPQRARVAAARPRSGRCRRHAASIDGNPINLVGERRHS